MLRKGRGEWRRRSKEVEEEKEEREQRIREGRDHGPSGEEGRAVNVDEVKSAVQTHRTYPIEQGLLQYQWRHPNKSMVW